MRVGIDFGTTRTVVAVADRGNYPVIAMRDAWGDSHDYLPSAVALRDDEITAGWEALTGDGATLARSFKRLLADPSVNGRTPVRMGEYSRPLYEVLSAYADEVARQIRRYQEEIGDTSTIQAVLGVPANASSAQRLLTLDAFMRAGIGVLAMVNEPSAAAFEYTHRHPRTLNSKRSSILVYDLGGGTFDTSLVHIDGTAHTVVSARGISRLGGDDFDEILLTMALKAADREGDAFGYRMRSKLLDEARSAKEQLKPQSKRLVLDLGGDVTFIDVNDFYDEIRPLIARTIDSMAQLIGYEDSLTDTDIAGIYLVGGSSALPVVPRMLRERYARRVHRSPIPGASTAVGLAIAADPSTDFNLVDRTARGIGVFRERDAGEGVTFDPLVGLDTQPDDDGIIRVTRRYRAAHNVGVFRFVEYTELNENGEPGDMALLKEVIVPFEAGLSARPDLSSIVVERRDHGPEVVEKIRINADGIARVSIELPETGLVVG
ncbi:Hsp70 family protein [Corynebacterium uterequi]|uniref:Molecular chaperone n=1 Tax=Corynebacterium uterequi TaxID=1072256 RepID=A0A0G3HEE6_9CORY|nr:Hsp70 family protein [Corynebacterium uterequi]AKK11649.1 molecular chaperone [Corynebacterium uterequi]